MTPTRTAGALMGTTFLGGSDDGKTESSVAWGIEAISVAGLISTAMHYLRLQRRCGRGAGEWAMRERFPPPVYQQSRAGVPSMGQASRLALGLAHSHRRRRCLG